MDGLLSIMPQKHFALNAEKLSIRGAQGKNSGTGFDDVFRSMQAKIDTAIDKDASVREANVKTLCESSFARHFGQCASETYYHVMDATSISPDNWYHEDFPFDKFFANNVDTSIFRWKPTRMNPSQLATDIQSKITGTLGKHAIVVPPSLDEKMKHDPALCEKVARNINQVYAFHTSGCPMLPLPGTKFYGTRVYSSVIILNEDGEVKHCRVSSGGGMIGPDEETMRQIEREQKRKAKRQEENHRLNEETATSYWKKRRALLKSDATSAASDVRLPLGNLELGIN